MTPRPDVPLSTGEIARLLGWSTRRAARWLESVTRDDPTIIDRRGRYRRITIADLRRVAPNIAKRFASDRDVDELREEFKEQRGEIELVARKLREFQQKSNDWYRGISARLNAVEKSLRDQTNGKPPRSGE